MHLGITEPRDIQGSYKSNIKTANVCQYPGCKVTTGLEEHHINPVKNIPKDLTPFNRSLIKKKRKTITLCNEHHKFVHSDLVS